MERYVSTQDAYTSHKEINQRLGLVFTQTPLHPGHFVDQDLGHIHTPHETLKLVVQIKQTKGRVNSFDHSPFSLATFAHLNVCISNHNK